MGSASVFAQQAEVRLLLDDFALVLRPQADGMTGEYEGVAVQAGAVRVYLSAGVVDGVVLIVGVNHPMVIVCERRREGAKEREFFYFNKTILL